MKKKKDLIEALLAAARSIEDLMEAYGGNPCEGHFACEERNIYIVEKTIKGDNDIDGDIA